MRSDRVAGYCQVGPGCPVAACPCQKFNLYDIDGVGMVLEFVFHKEFFRILMFH